ncbi:PhoU domain-containing protein [Sulfurimonas sp. C5]|uniref:phosphate signaling complex PhoU family protein n=1 Tax=Sulfurimonas sp. C5 TaxID=3036947 RepID=UPI002455B342|nr:PhoU domain-containing protein [Sulfurimonas sp. C5]MDH4944504.1 PhoU family transcriptional regulator [Sulfurimonas sp. C5]
MLQTFKTSVNEVQEKLINIGNDLVTANEIIVDAITDCNVEKFNNARDYIKNISSKTNEIDNLIIKILALYTPEAKDLRQVVAYFKITNELSRACANTRSFIRGFTDICTDLEEDTISEYAIPMQNSTIRAVKTAVSMISCNDSDELRERYEEVLIEENKTDDLYSMIEKNLIQKAETSSGEFEKYHRMLRALRKSEKIAGRAISMANLLLYANVGGSLQAS